MFADIRNALERADFVVICVTPENKRARWIHFEAGALWTRTKRARILPFVLDMLVDDLEAPLSQFRGATVDAAGIQVVLHAVEESFGVDRPAGPVTEPAIRRFVDTCEAAGGPSRGLGYDSIYHDEILSASIEIARPSTSELMRSETARSLARMVLSNAHGALGELAAAQTRRMADTEFLAHLGELFDGLGDGAVVRTVPGRLPWVHRNARHPFDVAFREADRIFAARQDRAAMHTLFIEPARGFSAQGDGRLEWKCCLEHVRRSDRGVRCHVFKRDDAEQLRELAGNMAEDLEAGMGWLLVEQGFRSFAVIYSPSGHGMRVTELRDPLLVELMEKLFNTYVRSVRKLRPNDWDLPGPDDDSMRW